MNKISFPWAVAIMTIIASCFGGYIWLFASAIDFNSYTDQTFQSVPHVKKQPAFSESILNNTSWKCSSGSCIDDSIAFEKSDINLLVRTYLHGRLSQTGVVTGRTIFIDPDQYFIVSITDTTLTLENQSGDEKEISTYNKQ